MSTSVNNDNGDNDEATTKGADAKSDEASSLTTTCSPDGNDDDTLPLLLDSTLFRLTRGLPKRELCLMISEADKCEADLLKDIELLEKALLGEEGNEQDEEAVDSILESPLTPMDQCWTHSALLGRLRGRLTVPSILSIQGSTIAMPSPLSKSIDAAALVDLSKHPSYTQVQEDSTILLAVWKRIHTNRAAIVFKKAVKPEDAPGYTDRIFFPMDLSLIRKMIVSRRIQSYADLHQYIGLISHNCVKYNGRESDYGIVAREFEAMADEAIRQAVTGIGRATVKPPDAVLPIGVAAATSDVSVEAAEAVSTDMAIAPTSAVSTVAAAPQDSS
jgi:Bromodomain